MNDSASDGGSDPDVESVDRSSTDADADRPEGATVGAESGAPALALDEIADREALAGESDGAASVGIRSRVVGLVALVLGLLGIVVALVSLFVIARAGFGASSAVDRLVEPVDGAIDRIETRIDQADDAVDPAGLETERLPVLAARSQSLLDMTITANQLFGAVEDHAVYGRLPIDVSALGDQLDDFEESATTIDGVVSGVARGDDLSRPDATIVADELGGLQARMADLRTTVDDAASSVRRWIRLGSLFGFFIILWGMWAQLCLARRGWRGLRGTAV